MRKMLLLLSLAVLFGVGCSSPPAPEPTPVSAPSTPEAVPTEAGSPEATPEANAATPDATEASPTATPEAMTPPKEVAAAPEPPVKKVAPAKIKPRETSGDQAPSKSTQRKKKALPKIELVGVMTGDKEQAMVKVDGKYKTLTRGDVVGPYTVTSIDRGEVGLRRRDTGQTRSIGMNLLQAEASNPVKARPRKKKPKPAEVTKVVPAAPPKAVPKPRKTVSPDGSVHLSNKDLDDDPPIQLEGGWRKFETGK